MWPSIRMLPVLVLQATWFGVCVYECVDVCMRVCTLSALRWVGGALSWSLHFWMVVNFISTWVLTKNGVTCQCLISIKDFPFLYHLENEKYKIIGYRWVRAQNAQISEAILVKADSISVLGFLQCVGGRQIFWRILWDNSILQSISALGVFKEGLFI